MTLKSKTKMPSGIAVALATLSLVSTSPISRATPNTEEQECIELMAHIRHRFEHIDLREYYSAAKLMANIPPEVTQYVDSVFDKAKSLNGVSLAEHVYHEVIMDISDGSPWDNPIVRLFGGRTACEAVVSGSIAGPKARRVYQEAMQKCLDEQAEAKKELRDGVEKVLDKLVQLVPQEQRQSSNADALYRTQLRAAREKLLHSFFGNVLDRARTHVAKYKEDDLVIVYTSQRNLLEAVQSYFNEPFLLYVQMAFGKRATIVVPERNPSGHFASIEDAFTNPKYQDVALVGHGSWSTIDVGGIAENPEDVLVKIILAYNNDAQKTADAVVSSLFGSLSPLEALGIQVHWDFIEQQGDYLFLGGHNNGTLVFGRSNPKKTGRLVKYTCGTGRYDNHLGTRLPLRSLSPDLQRRIYSPFFSDEFSALSPKYVGEYDAMLVAELRRTIQEHIPKVERAIRRNSNKVGATTYGNIQRHLEEARAGINDPLHYYRIREKPLFGTIVMQDPSKVYAYEGIAWLADFLRDPFPTVQHNLPVDMDKY